MAKTNNSTLTKPNETSAIIPQVKEKVLSSLLKAYQKTLIVLQMLEQ